MALHFKYISEYDGGKVQGRMELREKMVEETETGTWETQFVMMDKNYYFCSTLKPRNITFKPGATDSLKIRLQFTPKFIYAFKNV